MQRRLTISGLAFLLGIAACGLTVEGTSPSNADAGSLTDSGPPIATDAPNAPNANFCQQERQDPTVKHCFDFEGTGFEDKRENGGSLITEPSLRGSSGGLAANVESSNESRNVAGVLLTLERETYDAAKTVTVDVDLAIPEMTIEYAGIFAFEIVGGTCSLTVGLAIDSARNLVWQDGDNEKAMEELVPTEAFHLRLVMHPARGQSTETEAFFDGRALNSRTHAYDGDCNVARLLTGAFYTSSDDGTMRVRMDNLVVRVAN